MQLYKSAIDMSDDEKSMYHLGSILLYATEGVPREVRKGVSLLERTVDG